MKKERVIKSWRGTWDNFGEDEKLNPFALFYLSFIYREVFGLLKKTKIPKKAKLLDIGCGTGRTILTFLKKGYRNIEGIDVVESGISICKRKGIRKVRVMDAFDMDYGDKSFKLVFSEGLVEHFEKQDFGDLIKEFCRVAEKYVLLVQPNRKSLYRKLVTFLYLFIEEKGPPEKDYELCDYHRAFSRNGFYLKRSATDFLGGFWILLFERL